MMSDKLLLERNGFTFSGNLGAGNYGKVVCAYSTTRRHKVAVKILDTKKVESEYAQKVVSREIEILKSLKHPNIVRTFQVLEMKKNRKVYIVMELCVGGDLLTHIRRSGPIPEPSSCRLFLQLCDVVQFLHSKNVVHRDLKCENLLLDGGLNIRVCDFGFSRRLTYSGGRLDLSDTYCGTTSYEAPEVLSCRPYNPKVSDVWSMGVVLYVMLYATLPFSWSTTRSLLQVQRKRGLRFPDRPRVSSEAQDLIHRILHPSVEWRITISRILRTPWMRSRGTGEDRDQEDGDQDRDQKNKDQEDGCQEDRDQEDGDQKNKDQENRDQEDRNQEDRN